MANVIKLRVGDEELDAIEMQFEIKKEEWSEYKLYDGGTIRLKTSAHKIVRVVDGDGNPVRTEDGDPRMIVRHNTQVVSSD